MIRFACPGCGAVYAVEDEQAGKTGMCPKCRSQFVIPSPDGGPTPPPLPPEPPKPDAPPSLSSTAAPPPPPNPDEPVEVAPCPACGARLSVLARDLGVGVECPHCKTVFTATRAGGEPAAPAARTSNSGESGSVGDILGGGSKARDDDRPGRRRRWDGEEDDRPSRRSRRASRFDDEDDDNYDDRPRRSGRPSNVPAVGGMLLGGGIYALVQLGIVVLGSFFVTCLWPGVYFGIVWAILAIVRGAQMLNRTDAAGPPRVLCILQIIMIVNCDVVNMILGIVGLVLLNNPEVEEYYERQRSHAE